MALKVQEFWVGGGLKN